jgi:Ni,Fe-hydrogenase maturation factor
VHQLTPELAEELTRVDRAIFVDARLDGEAMEVSAIEPDESGTAVNLGHAINPRSLLSLAKSLYGNVPRAWLVAVPGENFEMCDRLSPTGEKGVEEALRQIEQLLEG